MKETGNDTGQTGKRKSGADGKVSAARLYRHYISVIIRSKMQYKKSFFMYSLGNFLVSFNVFAGIFFMFRKFNNVKGFTYSEVLLCYSIVLMAFSLAEMFARGFDTFPGMVRKGSFDRLLLRPRGIVLQVLGSQFEITRFGRVLQAVLLLGYSIWKGDVRWDFGKAMTVVFMIAGGMALFSGFFVIYASLSFFTLEGLEFMNIFTNGLKEYGKYPMGIYGKGLLWIMTFLIPFALVQYYPLLYLLDRRSGAGYIFLPLAAGLFLVPCYFLWRYGVRHYKSSGS
ncbi:MAG TPA: hypothetical protein DCZ91_14720 [Lachnospiraceae bacterium]|nr:hypothetical protein [Lachnospiraceae bacterium]